MKRIARQAAEGQPQVSEALAGYTELERLLRRHLSPSTATLFARPKATEGGIIEWYSDLDGQPIPFSQLTSAEANALQRSLQERLTSIEDLATQLQSQGDEGARQAALLRQAAAYPDLKNLYSLNGQPLVTFWGGGQSPIPPASPMAPAAAAGLAGAAALGATAAPVAPVAPVVAATAGRRLWPWLLALLLLAGLGAGLWWWLNQNPLATVTPEAPIPEVKPQPEAPKPEEKKPEEKKEEPKPEPVKEEEPKQEEPKPIEPEPKPEPKVEEKTPEKPEPEPVKPVVPVKPVEPPKPAVVPPAPKVVAPEPPPQPTPPPPPKPLPPPPPPPPSPLEQLEKRVQAAGNQCDSLQRLLQQEPLLQRPEGPAVDIKADIQRTLASRCREQMITNAKNLCPNERPKEVAPELVIVFDASGSMDLSMLATEQKLKVP